MKQILYLIVEESSKGDIETQKKREGRQRQRLNRFWAHNFCILFSGAGSEGETVSILNSRTRFRGKKKQSIKIAIGFCLNIEQIRVYLNFIILWISIIFGEREKREGG